MRVSERAMTWLSGFAHVTNEMLDGMMDALEAVLPTLMHLRLQIDYIILHLCEADHTGDKPSNALVS